MYYLIFFSLFDFMIRREKILIEVVNIVILAAIVAHYIKYYMFDNALNLIKLTYFVVNN